MSLLTATEWYKESAAAQASGATRDPEPDAAEADAVDEKVFE